MRRFLLIVGVMTLVASATLGDEFKGKVKDVDIFKKTVTVTVNGGDKVLLVNDDTKYTTLAKGKGKEGDPLVGGFLGLRAGSEVTATTAKKEDKDIVTAMKVAPPAKTKK